jgi:hypothetical protein
MTHELWNNQQPAGGGPEQQWPQQPDLRAVRAKQPTRQNVPNPVLAQELH